MRKWIVFIALILIPTFCLAMGIQNWHKKIVKTRGGVSYSDIIVYWGANNSDTADKSSGADSTFTRTGATFSTVQKKGTHSLLSDSTQEYAQLDISSKDTLDYDIGRIGFYIYVDVWDDDSFLFYVNFDSNNRITIDLDVDDEIIFLYKAGGNEEDVLTTGSPITSGGAAQWHFVEFVFNNTTDVYQIIVDGGTPFEDLNDGATPGAWGTAPPDFEWGNLHATNSATVYFDQLLISNDDTRDLHAIKDLTSFPD